MKYIQNICVNKDRMVHIIEWNQQPTEDGKTKRKYSN